MADKKKLIKAMTAAGYDFDLFESYKGNYRFFGPYGSVVTYSSLREIEEWLDGGVFHDPDVSDRVERIMAPGRFRDERKEE